jgi:hypothetical protein
MASRYTYWTIILADGPTSFRARDRDTLVPTLKQLQSRDPKAALKWFANGRLWDSPEQAREYARLARMAWQKTRGPEWRPGGEHRDPRDRFNKKKPKRAERRPPRPGGAGGAGAAGGGDRPGPSAPPKGPGAGPPSRVPRRPAARPPRDLDRNGRQRRPYRPTGGTRRGGGGGGRGGGGRGPGGGRGGGGR